MNYEELKALIEKVKGVTDVTDVISRYVKLNSNNKALCPFHKEENPSFSVNRQGQYWYCFGCGKGGDLIKFLELIEGKSFIEVVTELASKAGITMPNISPEASLKITEERTIVDILSDASEFYRENITKEAIGYLIGKRGLTEEIVNKFQIGFASGGLKEYLTKRCNYPLELCIKSGLLKRNEDKVYDFFYNRITFPNIKNGRVVYITGRSLDDKEPRYLNLHREISYIYNEEELWEKEVFVTEGIIDCLTLINVGYPAVAIYGANNFKSGYAGKFSNCEKVYICFDSDEAGKIAAVRVGELLADKVKIISIPKGIDVNELIVANGKEKFSELIEKADDVIIYQIKQIPEDTEKTELPHKLEPILKKLSQMGKARAEAYLGHVIKKRFKLKGKDIEGYRDIIKNYFKEIDIEQESTSKEDQEYIALFDGLIDLVEYNGESAFLVLEGDSPVIKGKVKLDGNIYAPPPIQEIPWLLPRGQEIMEIYDRTKDIPTDSLDRELYDALIAYHRKISVLPADEFYDLIVLWDMHTYLIENFQYSPIICLTAVPERGKSRTGQAMIYVAYRGIRVESLRDAYIVRVADRFQASLFFDVRDLWQKAGDNKSEDILLNRFERGIKVPRVLYPEKGAFKDIVYFRVFGPTVIATNQGVDAILETRAITINMPDTAIRFENLVKEEKSLLFKERLVLFRARHLGKPLPDTENPTHGRLGEILKPLLQIIRMVYPKKEQNLQNIIRFIKNQRMIEKTQTIEAKMLLVIISLKSHVENGILPVKVITDTYNEYKRDKYKMSYPRVGRILSSMGFQKTHTSTGAVAIIYDEKNIVVMASTYGLGKSSVTSDRSVLKEVLEDVPEVSDDTDGFLTLFNDFSS